jgi:hypothetical protein
MGHNLPSRIGDDMTVGFLDWFDESSYPSESFDIVVAADVVWLVELVPALVNTIKAVMKSPSTQLLLAHQSRSLETDKLLFSLLSDFLSITEISWGNLDPKFRAENIAIFLGIQKA